MRLTPEARSRLAMQHALGMLTPRVARRLERMRSEDAWLDGEVAGSERQFAQLGLLVPVVDAPAALRERVMGALPRRRPSPAPSGMWSNLWLWRSWAAAATAAALTVGVVPMYRQPSALVTDALETASAPAVVAHAPGPVGVTAMPAAAAVPSPAVAVVASTGDSGIGQRVADAAAAPTANDVADAAVKPAESVVAPLDQPMADSAATADRRGATRGQRAAGTSAAPGQQKLYLVSSADGVAAWLLRLDAEAGELHVRRLREETTPAGADYELWVLSDSGGPPRSIGILPDGDGGALALGSRQSRALRMAAGLAVSIEPKGGSTNGAPAEVRFSGGVVEI